MIVPISWVETEVVRGQGTCPPSQARRCPRARNCIGAADALWGPREEFLLSLLGAHGSGQDPARPGQRMTATGGLCHRLAPPPAPARKAGAFEKHHAWA